MTPPNGEPEPEPVDPLRRIEAQTKLANLKLKAELNNLGAALDQLFQIKVPELKSLTTPEELKSLIEAIEKGTADNRRLERFLILANTILSKL